MKLLIVESPAKARTIKGYLDKDFDVVSSIGHFRDLPQKGIGIFLDRPIAIAFFVVGFIVLLFRIKTQNKSADI